MIGVGITMEGINQNEIMYEFALEQSWRKPLNTTGLGDWYYIQNVFLLYDNEDCLLGWWVLLHVDILKLNQFLVQPSMHGKN